MGKVTKKTRHVEVMDDPMLRRSTRSTKPSQKLADASEVQSLMSRTRRNDDRIQAMTVDETTKLNDELRVQLKLAQEKISKLEKQLATTKDDMEINQDEELIDLQLPSSSRLQLDDVEMEPTQRTNEQHGLQGSFSQKSRQFISDEDNVQQMLTQALAKMINPDHGDKGEDIMSRLLILGATLDPKIKARIWAREYIELSTLREKGDPCVSVSLENNGKPSISLKTTKGAQPASFNQWLQLFMTYAAVYLEKYPEEAPSMLTYMMRISDMAKKPGYLWRSYDEGFRKVRAVSPVLWHKTNWDLVFNTQMNAEPNFSVNRFQPFRRNQTVASQVQNRSKQGICYSYNNGNCTSKRVPCPFRHDCQFCGKRGHPRVRCYARQNSNQTTQRGNNNNNNNNSNRIVTVPANTASGGPKPTGK